MGEARGREHAADRRLQQLQAALSQLETRSAHVKLLAFTCWLSAKMEQWLRLGKHCQRIDLIESHGILHQCFSVYGVKQ